MRNFRWFVAALGVLFALMSAGDWLLTANAPSGLVHLLNIRAPSFAGLSALCALLLIVIPEAIETRTNVISGQTVNPNGPMYPFRVVIVNTLTKEFGIFGPWIATDEKYLELLKIISTERTSGHILTCTYADAEQSLGSLKKSESRRLGMNYKQGAILSLASR